MQLRKNRVTERAAVNAAQSFFESAGCVFQDVDQGNDYGKDAYVDLVERQNVTGWCIALQIKGGVSYRRATGYAIPIDGHEDVWRQSSLPIAGIIFDPEKNALFWCDISSFFAAHVARVPSEIPVSSDDILNKETLESEFKPLFIRLAKERGLGVAILQITSDNPQQRLSALMDCFASGRTDARVFIALRYMLGLLRGDHFRRAIGMLAHATPHPDIFWCKDNWIPPEVEAAIKPHFCWTTCEITRFLTEIPMFEWQRGGFGQHAYSILVQDREIEKKMKLVAISAMREGKEEIAWHALYYCLYWARDESKAKYQELLKEEPRFRTLELAGDLEEVLEREPRLTLFE